MSTINEFEQTEVISNVTAYYLIKHIWDGIPKNRKNDMAQEILDLLKDDPEVSNEQLEAYKFYLKFKSIMPTIKTFYDPQHTDPLYDDFEKI